MGWTKENFKRMYSILGREFGHAREKIVEGRASTYRVASPEDITAPKLVRSVGALNRNPDLCTCISSNKPVPFSDERVRQELRKIRAIREEASLHLGDAVLSERLRFVSDLYDVRLLSELVGFNEAYMGAVVNSWETLSKTQSPARDLLFNFLLPKMSLLRSPD